MIGRAYRTAQILSLDIVIGAVILLRFFCAQFQVSPRWEVYVLLAGTVWLIYTADHLRDAEKSVKSNRERYLFHKKNKRLLITIAIILLLFLALLIFFIPIVIFLGGLVLGSFSFIYLLVQHRLSRFLSKELYVALVYSLGILMVPMLLSQTFQWDILVLLILLTFVNLTIFSWYEREDDIKDKFRSIATEMNTNQLEKVILIMISIGLAIAILNISLIHGYFAIGFLVYALMIVKPDWFISNHKYRTIGDGVFLLPIFFEWL
jgi:4-hydroxybenzoate polyprenyltransferase